MPILHKLVRSALTILMGVTMAFLPMALPGGIQSHALSILVKIDRPATDEDLRVLNEYFHFERNNTQVYTLKFGPVRIFRLESPQYCAKRLCLTLVIDDTCQNRICPHVF